MVGIEIAVCTATISGSAMNQAAEAMKQLQLNIQKYPAIIGHWLLICCKCFP
jgi:hypothetical protein